MQNLEWLETFALGVPEIDRDHKELLASMKRVVEAAEVEDFDLCGQRLDELVDLSKAHFKREEDLLREADYPHVDLHEEYHSALFARSDEMKNVCQVIKSKDGLKACCDEMFSFLIGGDLKFKSFLQEKGLIDTR